MIRARLLLSSGLFGLTAMPAVGQEVRAEVTTSASAGYQSNPFLVGTEGISGPTTTIEVDPRLSIKDEDSLITINGAARLDYFLEDGRTNDSVRLDVDAQQRTSERLELNAGAAFTTTRNALLDAVFTDPAALSDDLLLPDPVIIDPTVVGEEIRTTTFSAVAGAELQLNPVSGLTGQISSTLTRFDGQFANNFAITSGSLQYVRAVSQRTSLGIISQLAYSTFERVGTDDAGPNFGGNAVLGGASGVAEVETSATGKLRVQAGFTVVDFDLGAVGSETSTVATATASFCEQVFAGSLCVTGARQPQPVGLGGVATVSTGGVGWTKQVNRTDTFSFSARYSVVEQPELSLRNLLPELRTTRLFGVSPTYRRKVRSDLQLFITANYSDASGGFVNVNENYSIRAGIAKTFGGPR